MKMGLGSVQTGLIFAAVLSVEILVEPKTHAQPGSVAWVQRYSNVTDSEDVAQKIVTDADGNVIVAGSSNDGITGTDWVIIKYSNAGVPLWTNRYGGPGNSSDNVSGVAVGSSGNVFVTGGSIGSGGGYDYTTIKYSGAGLAVWTNRYSGPANRSGSATAIVVDGSGNVIVTGYSMGSGTFYDYATLAYSSAGVALWTNRYNGPGNDDDKATAVAVDGSGNVFVTGHSRNGANDFDYDYATLAYSSAGTPLWTNRYNGPTNHNDFANALVVDGSGNVFVTGYSRDNECYSECEGYYEFATLAYSSAGVPLWTNLYNGPGYGDNRASAVAVDGNGRVFVAGYSGGDYKTIAYAVTGVPLWTNRYNGPRNFFDQANAVAVDGNGNVFVTGLSFEGGGSQSYATIAYSGAGVPLWTNRYNGIGNGEDQANAVTVDKSGNVFVTGYSAGSYLYPHNNDFVTIGYSNIGVPLWTNRCGGTGNGNDGAVAVAVDGSGNVFVTGSSIGSSGSYYDYATLAYSAAGVPLWTNRYNGTGNGEDRATAIAVDVSGNVFVTGSSIGSGGRYDYATIKYSGAGVPLWTHRYHGAGNSDAQTTAIAVDRIGNVIVTGYSDYGDYGWTTIKYSGEGMPLWTNRYNEFFDRASAVAMDGNGNAFVTGYSYCSGYCSHYTTVAYSSAGAPLWTNSYRGPEGEFDQAAAVAVDRSGNVFVTGSSHTSTKGYDYATVAYSNTGVPLWTRRYNGPGNNDDQALAVAVDGDGNVFVTGASGGSGTYTDYATLKYSGAGALLWTRRYNGPANSLDYAAAVAVDESGNVFVAGFSEGNGYDYATIAYSNAGVPLWTNRYNGPANGDDQVSTAGKCLALALDGVIVVGASDGDFSFGAFTDYAVVQYNIALPVSITAVEKLGSDLRLSFTSQAAYHYNVQARANLASGDWTAVVTNIPGVGAVTEITITNALLEPKQFYRIQQAP